MAQDYGTAANPAVDTAEAINTNIARAIKGIDAARTTYSGTSAPSDGTWGASEVGAMWLDTGTSTAPVLKIWALLASGGPAYGWRIARLKKIVRVHETSDFAAPAAVTMGVSSPAGSSSAWTTVSLATSLSTIQESTHSERKVIAVKLLVTVAPGASETISGVLARLEFRKTGETDVLAYAEGVAASRASTKVIDLPLDASEQFDWRVIVGGGTPSFAFTASIVEYSEEI